LLVYFHLSLLSTPSILLIILLCFLLLLQSFLLQTLPSPAFSFYPLNPLPLSPHLFLIQLFIKYYI
jgi:hypothetical protein